MNAIRLRQLPKVCLVIFLAIFAGCSNNEYGGENNPEESNLKPLMIVYSRYVPMHRGRMPKSVDDLKKFAERELKKDPTFLSSLGYEGSVDDLFISNRDEKPFVIIFNPAEAHHPEGFNEPIIAYEQEGSGGKRFVADAMGSVELVDNSTFSEWYPNATK